MNRGLFSFGQQPVAAAAAAVTGLVLLGSGSLSGAAIDITGVPSTAKRVTIGLSGMSTNGTSDVLVRVGSSGGGIATSGYLGSAGIGSTASNFTVGFDLFGTTTAPVATSVGHGIVELLNLGGNIWAARGILGQSDTNAERYMGGSISLGAVLDRIRLTMVNGTDVFDAGTYAVYYE